MKRGETGECGGWDGSEIVAAEEDGLEGGEIGERRERAGEGVTLERNRSELGKGVEIGGECSGEGVRSEAYGSDAIG